MCVFTVDLRESVCLRWGSLGAEENESLRPEFIDFCKENDKTRPADAPDRGTTLNVYTGDDEYSYPSHKRQLKYFITFGVPFLMMCMVTCVIVGVFYLRYWLESSGYPGAVAGVANGIVIAAFNAINKILAVKLTELEHHRTDTEFSDSLIAKAFLFQFINNYGPLYLVAFLKANADALGVDEYLGVCKCRDFEGLNGKAADTCVQADLYPINDPTCRCNQPSCIDELALLLVTVFGVQLTVGE